MGAPQDGQGTMLDYQAFLARKQQRTDGEGFAVTSFRVPQIRDWQAELTAWALRRARAAIFADTGLGKTLMQLVWADEVVRHTGGDVLILTPLAVAHQTVAEAEKFGIAARRSTDGRLHRGITVSTYERVQQFDSSRLVGVVCDESARLKAFDGARRAAVTAFLRHVPYRLLCSATPAPNDYTELGTASEALGELGLVDMLNRFFKNEQNTSATNRFHGRQAAWRFRGHAEEPFWRWVCSWARALRRPSDLGYDDGAYVLPPLVEREQVIATGTPLPGMLLPVEAATLREQRLERRATLEARCAAVAALVDHADPALVWCHYNEEGDLLERLIAGAVQVAGHEADERKEEKLIAFARGQARVLVTKPTIAGWGLNLQHCAHTTFFPSHSFEQYYQGVRRCWRYGQTRPVVVDVVTTPGERRVLANLQAKAAAADRLFSQLIALMQHGMTIAPPAVAPRAVALPGWLGPQQEVG